MPVVGVLLKHPKLLCQAGILLLAARVLISIMPVMRVRRVLSAIATALAPYPASEDFRMERIAWGFLTVNRRLGLNCLPLALAAQALMNRYGHAVLLQIGVTRKDNRFSAHAWLESGGNILVGGPASFVADYLVLRS